MSNISFKYDYPYASYSSKYGWNWAESQIKINGNYTYPAEFNTTLPICSHFSFTASVENTGSGSVFGIYWEVYVYTSSWIKVGTFTMPSDGSYTFDGDVDSYNINKFLMVPSTTQSKSKEWSISYSVNSFTIRETLPLNEPQTGTFQYSVFPNQYGVTKGITEMFANVDGTLTRATKVLVNVDDELKEMQGVYSAYLKTNEESTSIYMFKPNLSGTYRIKRYGISGSHQIRLYDASFNQIDDSYFTNDTFELTKDTTYYITLMNYANSQVNESYLQIYKEE